MNHLIKEMYMRRERQEKAIARWEIWIEELTNFLRDAKLKAAERLYWNDKLDKAKVSLENTVGH